MDYLYENLGDERFQEFCNDLIAKEFPDSQCFPLGQPDGGRDALVYFMDTPKKEFIVFQVKFVRNPSSIVDVHKWLTKVIADEAPKVKKLIPKGAVKYYLITNVKGTGHLDTGSIDKVNEILESNISIPSVCWWRDTLSRLFEKDPLFKWSFPEIINGQDILNSVLFQYINEHKERRENTIKAYLSDQYHIDSKVKFKQIDLDNRLFDLFTDVPLRIKKFNQKNKAIKKTLFYLENFQRRLINIDDVFFFEERENIGAASFLLDPIIQSKVERILLEGGPGQGKSTISQYICQVHRVRLLSKQSDLILLPEKIKISPARLPFKIDLRHVAAWVDKKNPYQERLNDDYFNSIWKNSLESFLVGHIIYHSQTDDFNASDLLAVTKLSPVLFVFDGFDEIADTKIREEIIDFINRGINRISENSRSIQVVITSRPAAFSDTIGFSEDLYPHFELTDITQSITAEYVEKWIRASRLNAKEGKELKRLVDEKLQMPHLRELAKSPMQLAIFISLLRTRGESLPNKRTALYDSYIELFFNRESEKSTTIRDHRDLIIDIHQYLAWILHSEAELLNHSGSIHINDLKDRLNTYLLNEGHKTDIADKLFHVMEERVCALVSRVQGTYEFEVQPLREYFCAKYLYNTSPYSPAGSEKKGTKPERFDAIARNFYWHNVVRFFAGCFDKGELPMLIQKLKELEEDPLLKNTNYPRLLTSQILSDWVFTQYPLLLKGVVKIIVDGINIGGIINQDGMRNHNSSILLPNDCGRLELTEECFIQLKKFPRNDYALELITIIRNNPYKTLEYWEEGLNGLDPQSITKWIQYAYWLEILHRVDFSMISHFLIDCEPSLRLERLKIFINGNRLRDLVKVTQFKTMVLESILGSDIHIYERRNHENSLLFLSLLLQPNLLRNIANSGDSNVPVLNQLSQLRRFSFHDKEKNRINQFVIEDEIDQKIFTFSQNVNDILEKGVSEWNNTIEPWDTVVEQLRKCFDERWAFNIVAVIAAGIKSRNESYDSFSDLYDKKLSLCKRVKHARARSGNIKYWEGCLKASQDNPFVLLVMLTWATPKTLTSLIYLIASKITDLSPKEYLILKNGLSKTTPSSLKTNVYSIEIKKLLLQDLPPEVKYLISYRLLDDHRNKFIYKNIPYSTTKMDNVNDIKLKYLIVKYLSKSHDSGLLEEIKILYSSLRSFKNRSYNHLANVRSELNEMPIAIANQVMSESKNYPRIIASIAERTCRLYANRHTKMVGQIAKQENWFEFESVSR